MKRAAIGVRMHSGWGALVDVSNSAGTVEVIDRRRVTITAPGTPGANQPYHFAENLELPEAEKFLGNCLAASKRLALAAVQDVVGETAWSSISCRRFCRPPSFRSSAAASFKDPRLTCPDSCGRRRILSRSLFESMRGFRPFCNRASRA
jgi:hypothetical protein